MSQSGLCWPPEKHALSTFYISDGAGGGKCGSLFPCSSPLFFSSSAPFGRKRCFKGKRMISYMPLRPELLHITKPIL